jgi:hypothetical protein
MTCPIPSSPPMVATSKFVQTATSLQYTHSQIQVEYAVKAVENGGTAVGIRCKDGVVLALEKLVTSKLLKPGANKRISTIDRNMGVVSSPLVTAGHNPQTTGFKFLELIQNITGLLWPSSRWPPLRISRSRRSSIMALHVQGPHPHLRSRKSHGKLRPGIYSLLQRATVWYHGHRSRLGL